MAILLPLLLRSIRPSPLFPRVSAVHLTDTTIHAAVKGRRRSSAPGLLDDDGFHPAYGHISAWDVSRVTNMQELFLGKRVFDQPIGSWDVSSVTDMSGMFYEVVPSTSRSTAGTSRAC